MNISKDGLLLRCDKCGQQFADGGGISGMADDAFRDYCFDCASVLHLIGDLYGNLAST